MSEPNDTQPTPDPELVRQRQQTQLEVWQENQRAQVEIRRAQAQAELAAAVESGLYQRLAWARAVAQSDLVPAGFRARRNPAGEFYPGEVEKAAASIVLAQEWGEAIGLGGMKALMHLQVIEGNIGVKPASARGLMESKGVIIEDEWVYSAHGEPIACTTTALRPGREKPNEAEYTIEDAVRDRLCTVERDDAGEVTGVRARGGSNKDKVLPWEKRTKDMLMWRATSRLVRAHYQDMVGGMDFATDFEPETEEAPAPPPLSDAASAAIQKVAAQRADRNGNGYDPTNDLALFSDADPWWNYAEAQVTRRSKKQMAADRLLEAAYRGDERVPVRPDNAPNAEQQRDSAMAEAAIDPVTGLPETMVRPVTFDPGPEITTEGNPNPIDARLAEEPIEMSPGGFITEVNRDPEPESIEEEMTAGAEAGLDTDAPGGWDGPDPGEDDGLIQFPEPPEDWTPSRQTPETKEQLLARLHDLVERSGRDNALERFYILRGGRHEDDWTEEEIRDTIARLSE